MPSDAPRVVAPDGSRPVVVFVRSDDEPRVIAGVSPAELASESVAACLLSGEGALCLLGVGQGEVHQFLRELVEAVEAIRARDNITASVHIGGW